MWIGCHISIIIIPSKPNLLAKNLKSRNRIWIWLFWFFDLVDVQLEGITVIKLPVDCAMDCQNAVWFFPFKFPDVELVNQSSTVWCSKHDTNFQFFPSHFSQHFLLFFLYFFSLFSFFLIYPFTYQLIFFKNQNLNQK